MIDNHYMNCPRSLLTASITNNFTSGFSYRILDKIELNVYSALFLSLTYLTIIILICSI